MQWFSWWILMTRRGLRSQKGSWTLCSLMKHWQVSHSSSWATRLIFHMQPQKTSCGITLG
ncbi:hypothetical protein Goshw_003843 [Gossypium schwendimanii]|uniref:Uncharacterized protein n=2 Tax=Gossypium TaxID=3633 RepID=A0A7J9KB11_9ROSI|nr:hypothetical protein [Gossypium armourianum]MBA0873550.1 hypothetical protein [Gossypium schwendimanii]